MDVGFRETSMDCLQEQAAEIICQEETAELIVPDSSADVQSVVCSSAVGCIRDVTQTDGSVSVSGSFQTTLLYVPEGEGIPCVLETWMPFSVKLTREEIAQGGTAVAELRVRSVDARILNSRKVLVRVSYAVRILSYGRSSWKLCTAEETEHVQLLHTEVSGLFPVASAEKSLTRSETVMLQQAGTEVRRIVRAVPEVRETECRLADGQAVWKGSMQLHLVYLTETGALGVFDTEMPISQLLDAGDAPEDSTLRAVPILSEFRMEQEDGGSFSVTFGIRIQIIAWKKLTCTVITDGYGIGAPLQPQYTPYRFTELLDTPSASRMVEGALHGSVRKVIDCGALVDFPVCRRGRDEMTVSTGVTMNVLYYAEDGSLGGEAVHGEGKMTFALNSGALCLADAVQEGNCYASVSGTERTVACGVLLSGRCLSERTVQGMTKAELGDPIAGDSDRPSLIVRRAREEETLWQIAKEAGTPVQSVRDANGLTGEVQEGMLLLIPTR